MEQEEQHPGSSRIYVAGLPPYLDDKRLRETFGERGEITDSKVMKTRDGRSRQFGFVGFRSVEQAQDAIHYFNNSYVDTHRIQVKFAEKAQSSTLERPWSVYSEGSSRHRKRTMAKEAQIEHSKGAEAQKKPRTRQGAQDPDADDPELAEFLRVMAPRSKTATWANDDAVPAAAKPGSVKTGRGRRVGTGSAKEAMTDGEAERKDLLGAIVQGGNSRVYSEPEDDATADGQGGAARQIDAVVTDTAVSDLDYLKARMRGKALNEEAEAAQTSDEEAPDDAQELEAESDDSDGTELQADLEDREGSESGDEDAEQGRKQSNKAASTSAQEEGAHDLELIAQTGRLFLRNLSYQASEQDLAELFEEYGELSEVHLVKDRVTRKSKGIALVQFMEASDAKAAYAALDGSIFQGRLIHILAAKPVPQSHVQSSEDAGEEGAKGAGFQQQKAADQKAGAGNRAAWNTLFMRPDTVAEAVAAHYGISKSQLLDKEAADLPVRMALGEAHVIALTKASLAEAGVDVAALEASAAQSGKSAVDQPGSDRSSTTLLVKNLPYTATEADILDMFSKVGLVARLVLPETKTLALVEYQKPGEARQAFKTLAFKRFQTAPLFLEWAPKDIFSGAALAKDQGRRKQLVEQTEQPVDLSSLKGSEEDAESKSIYVKNLSWATKDAGLLKHFDATISAAGGSIRAARVKLRKGADGKQLSAGYGFVECSSEAVAKAAIKKLQGSMIDGHKLDLRLSMRKGAAPQTVPADKAQKDAHTKSTKIVVRNVAFEATSKEIRALFQPFGQIKSVRLPKKFNNSHRGFAFVDFLSHQEAVNAMDSVAGTHLYGRRLVTEWAAQDEGLDELRVRTAAKFQDA